MMLPPAGLRRFIRSIELEISVPYDGLIGRDSSRTSRCTRFVRHDDPDNDWIAPVKNIKLWFKQVKDISVLFTDSQRGDAEWTADLRAWVKAEITKVADVRQMLQAGQMRMLYR